MEVCRECNKTIEDEFVLAVGSSFLHQECLRCSVCCHQLTDSCFSKFDQFYCKKDFYKMFGPKCGACHLVFAETDKVCSIGQSQFHVDCFSCSKCGVSLDKGMKAAVDDMGNLLCEEDFLTTKETIETPMEEEEEEYEDKENILVSKTDESNDDIKLPESPDSQSESEKEDKEEDDEKKEGKDGKRRGPRTTIRAKQFDVLKSVFEQTPKPSRLIREQVAKETGLPMRVIQVWFQNKRSKVKRMTQLRFMANQGSFYPHNRGIHPMQFPPNAIAFDYTNQFHQEVPPYPQYFPQEEQTSFYPSPPQSHEDFSSAESFSISPCFPSPPLSDYSPPQYQLPQSPDQIIY